MDVSGLIGELVEWEGNSGEDCAGEVVGCWNDSDTGPHLIIHRQPTTLDGKTTYYSLMSVHMAMCVLVEE